MGDITILVTVLFLIVLGVYGVNLWRKRYDGVAHLKREYVRKLRMPEDLAREVMERTLERLKEKHPGRSEKWYLEKMLYDLDRDQR